VTTQSEPLRQVTLDYVNHRGERARRTVIPGNMWFGRSRFHDDQGEQWFLRAFDMDRRDYRDFAMRGIKEWVG
jgi:predicted DNA-binding transcriptional regulator YafY